MARNRVETNFAIEPPYLLSVIVNKNSGCQSTMKKHAICVALVAAVSVGGTMTALAQAPEANAQVAPAMQPAPPAASDGTGPRLAPATPAEPAPLASATFTELVGEEIAPERSSNLPHNLSPWGMFMGADIVVKAVMLGLAFASLVTWTVWVGKTVELAIGRRRTRRATEIIVGARSLQEAAVKLENEPGAASLLVRAARQEVAMSEPALGHVDGAGLKERVASRLSRIEAQAARRMSKGTGIVATIGSTAPFVGLFGTVWGIMNSFIGISEAQTTNLAVVAPGIAEALLATAIGLVAAIPAVVIYNVFARRISGDKQLLADAAAGVERLVSRDLDNRAVPLRALAAE